MLRAFAARRAAAFGEPAAPVPRPPSLADLLATPAEAFDRELLAADPLFRRLAPGEAERIAAEAVADGRGRAASWTGRTPDEVAAALGLAVRELDGDNLFGSVFQFAEYRSRPPQVLLYASAMARLRNLIAQHGLAGTIGIEDPRPLYLAHEVYHHLATLAPGPPRAQATVLALGPVRVTSRLTRAAEVGAAAFAAALTGARRHPRLVDKLVLLRPADTRSGAAR